MYHVINIRGQVVAGKEFKVVVKIGDHPEVPTVTSYKTLEQSIYLENTELYAFSRFLEELADCLRDYADKLKYAAAQKGGRACHK